jgi:hypothetical protein
LLTQTVAVVAVTGQDDKELWLHSKSEFSGWLINCAIFNSFLVYKNLNRDSKLKYKAFVINVAKIWATDQMLAAKRVSVPPGPSTPTPG